MYSQSSHNSNKEHIKILIKMGLMIILIIGLRVGSVEVSAIKDYDSIKNNKIILSAFKVKNNDISLEVNGKVYGSLQSKNDCKKVLTKVAQLYRESLNIHENKIKEISIEGELKYTNAFKSVSQVQNTEEIAKKIYDDNEVNNIIKVNIKTEQEAFITIEPNEKIVYSNDLYLGESKIEEGEKGLKKVKSENTYLNNKLQEEKILEQNIIKESKDKIIYKGTKDPVSSNVAFLKKPTRGGYITSNFGPRWGKNHNGMDIAGNIGDPVIAAFDGVVKIRHYENGYGNVIFLSHENELETIYGHLNGFNVVEGQTVKKGDTIGFVGNTGDSTGPHLHFELRVNGNAIDPQKYINFK